MKYNYSRNVRQDEQLRASFNELTQKVYGFNFIDWYQKGYWSDKYIPHVLVDNGKVISNVSVNLMKFEVNGEIKNYIQLGTVMTDPDYRGQGLNKYILERILEEYEGKVDGFYLFGNDSVLEYYPKFGFRPIQEYEYSLKLRREAVTDGEMSGYQVVKVDLSDQNACERLYQVIQKYDAGNKEHNPNDSFSMYDNLGLYQFCLAEEYKESVYYLPDIEAYVIADFKSGILNVYQIISKSAIDMEQFAVSLNGDITEIKLWFTPTNKDEYEVGLHKVEDSTLFIIGESLEQVETEKRMFSVISHA
ncbi:Acetyltransferase (GNAT) domain-containing protein [Anaeromicropila populeti]|uniref:Acetyltransferase (GNAT) domain-containing protein n=2 Tax=Anaeromicropila populeti TaxID=37658 RepID=A0A1I6IFI7_9FIRM|nr:Acetyltransferase (GNAT) domain-containing protein [Anaeromicropila populeti]